MSAPTATVPTATTPTTAARIGTLIPALYTGTPISAPAIIVDMPNDAYHALKGSVSKSGLDLVARSPAHFYHAPARATTRNMEIGTAVHTALLEPERFNRDYVLLEGIDDRRKSEYKAAAAVHGGEYVLTASESANVLGIQQSVRANPLAHSWLSAPGLREASIFAVDPETGIMCRIRPDLLTDDGHIVDVKTTQDARTDAFERAILNYRYHVQAAFYSDVFEWATGQRPESFRFVAIEPEAPNAVMVYHLDDIAMEQGRREYRAALNTYARCVETDEWPAYDCATTHIIGLPAWAVDVDMGEIV